MTSEPNFRPGREGVLFFSRGRGRGHALVDIAVAEQLAELREEVDVRFVSYATGAEVFCEHGCPVIDLQLPEQNSPIETLIHAARLIGYLRPTLVVSHEEFAVPAAAKISGTPVVFLTDWFTDSSDFNMHLIGYADQVIVMDQEGIYDEPPQVTGRVHYVNPVLRQFSYTSSDRSRARRELGLPEDVTVVSVLVRPGRRTEAVAPIFDLLLPAFRSLSMKNKRLVWLAGDDAEAIRVATKDLSELVIKHSDEPFDRLMVASDLAITKGNRNIVLELAALSVPSISITHQLNYIDDYRISLVPSNQTFNADELDSRRLAQIMEDALSTTTASREPPLPWRDGRTRVAELLGARIDQLIPERHTDSAASRNA